MNATERNGLNDAVANVHRYGFHDPKNFVVGLLDCGWEPGAAFTEALCEQCPDLDFDDVEDWVEEWRSGTD